MIGSLLLRAASKTLTSTTSRRLLICSTTNFGQQQVVSFQHKTTPAGIAAAAFSPTGNRCFLSTQPTDAIDSPPVAKLKEIMTAYRQENFTQTLYSRFVKEVLQAVDVNHDGKISFAELRGLLKNIGVSDKMTDTELMAIFNELGRDDEIDDESGAKLIWLEDVETVLLSSKNKHT